MIIFAGIGISPPKSIPFEVLEEAKSCEYIFIELFTSPIREIKSLEEFFGKKIKILSRKEVEEGSELLKLAKLSKVMLLSYGDPMMATTHSALRVRAVKEGIESKVIHASSIVSALFGSLGLHTYKMGKWVTITKSSPSSSLLAYRTIYNNLLNNLHSPLLLEYNYEEDFFLEPKEALKMLKEREEEQHLNLIHDDTLVIVISRLGSKDQDIKAHRLKEIINYEFNGPPHTLIIPCSLHFTEAEALKYLLNLKDEILIDNSLKIRNRLKAMIEKYYDKTMKALVKARNILNAQNLKGYDDLLENSELYAKDSLKFLNEGNYELAILSMAYSEGLLDSLRFLNLKGFEDLWK